MMIVTGPPPAEPRHRSLPDVRTAIMCMAVSGSAPTLEAKIMANKVNIPVPPTANAVLVACLRAVLPAPQGAVVVAPNPALAGNEIV